MTKSTITRERLEELAAGQSGFNLRIATHEESQELACMALAAMDSEPVTQDEREAFEAFMAKRFGDLVDQRRAKNGDHGYMAWDMVVAWTVWQARAAMLQAEPVTTANKLGNSPAIPDGYVMVPMEPTEEMNKAGWAAMNEHDAINPTYRAMLAAAPQEVKGE